MGGLGGQVVGVLPPSGGPGAETFTGAAGTHRSSCCVLGPLRP